MGEKFHSQFATAISLNGGLNYQWRLPISQARPIGTSVNLSKASLRDGGELDSTIGGPAVQFRSGILPLIQF